LLDGSVDPGLRRLLLTLSEEEGLLELVRARVMEEIMEIHDSWRALGLQVKAVRFETHRLLNRKLAA
jgi:hypothetical protein